MQTTGRYVLPERAAAVTGDVQDHVQNGRDGQADRRPADHIQRVVRPQVHPRQPVAGGEHHCQDSPAARQHQHQQPSDRESDNGVTGGKAQPMVRHPPQDCARHRRPRPLPPHQQLGNPLQDQFAGHHQHQSGGQAPAPPRQRASGVASTPRYWAASIGRYSQPGSPLMAWNTARSAGPTRPSAAITAQPANTARLAASTIRSRRVRLPAPGPPAAPTLLALQAQMAAGRPIPRPASPTWSPCPASKHPNHHQRAQAQRKNH